MNSKVFILFFLCNLCSLLCFSQVNSLADIHETYAHYQSLQKESPDTFLSRCKQENAIKDEDLVRVKSDTSSWSTSDRYQQYYKGAAVLGGEYVIHHKNGELISANGNLLPHISIEKTGLLDDGALINKARDHFKYRLGHQVEDVEVTLFPDYYIADESYPLYSGVYTYVRKVEILKEHGSVHNYLFIDAHDGKLVAVDSRICTHGVPSTGYSLYYGEVDFVSDSLSENVFELKDPERNIAILNSTYEPYRSESSNWDLSETNEQAAIDAMYASTKFYDMMKGEFNWEGMTNDGSEMACVMLSQEEPYVNAYYDGQTINIGFGDCTYGPLSTLLIVGHEYMHGVTQNTSDLDYYSESGGLNEGLSDIFGLYLDYIYDPEGFNWEIGIKGYDGIFRDVRDPWIKQDPKAYDGKYWRGNSIIPVDSDGVHSKSGVLNHWLYLLVNGGNGMNEFGTAYDVPAIGWEKIMPVVWETAKNYLTSSSSFSDMYEASLVVAGLIYGENSAELNAITESWKAVGLPSEGVADYNDLFLQEIVYDNPCLGDSLYINYSISNGEKAVNEPTVLKCGIIHYFADRRLAQIDTFEVIIDSLEANEMFDVEAVFPAPPGRTVFSQTAISTEEDKNRVNDTKYIFEVFSREDGEVELNEIAVEPSSCSSELDLKLKFNFDGCNSTKIDEGMDVKFYGRDENGDDVLLESRSIQLNDWFYSTTEGETEVDFTLDLDVSQYDNIYKIKTISPEDARSITQVINLPVVSTIEDVYYEDFESEESPWSGNQHVELKKVNGDTKLFATGAADEDNYFCGRFIEWPMFFDAMIGLEGSFSWDACVDFRHIDNPVLSFDLTQYRSDTRWADTGFTSFTYVKVTSSKDQSVVEYIFSGLEEGREENKVVNLPGNFEGSIYMSTYTYRNEAGSLEDSDVQVIDNISLGYPSSTSLDKHNEEAIAYPNPTEGRIHLKTADEIKHFTIADYSGRFVQRGTYEDYIEVSTLPPGFYLIHALGSDDKITVFKFMKR